MRAHVELSPAERKLLTTLTAEERQVVIAQMIESECEELEWQIAVEQARSVAETVPALIARAAPPPIPRQRAQSRPAPRATAGRPLPPRYRWSSPVVAAKR
jgi:hypothetical protein